MVKVNIGFCSSHHLSVTLLWLIHSLNAKLTVAETPSGEGPDYDYHKHPTSHFLKHSCKIGDRSYVRGNISQLIWIITHQLPSLKSCSIFLNIYFKTIPQWDSQILPCILCFWIHGKCSNIISNGLVIHALKEI